MSTLEARHIEDISILPTGIHAVHFKNGKPPLAIRDPEVAENLITKLRAFRRSEADPQDRIIAGIDARNQLNAYDYDAEKAAIRKTLSLRELRSWRDLDENTVNFLCGIVSLADYHTAINKGLKSKYGALVNLIKNNEAVIQNPQFTTHEVDTLKNMLKLINEMYAVSDRFDTATLTLLQKWIPDYGSKEEDEEAK